MEVSRDDGQILPLLALVIAGAACAVLAIGALGDAAVQRARAVVAADAAALAGAASGAAAAHRLARANGGELVDIERLGPNEVRVHVEHGDARASARARAGARARTDAGVALSDGTGGLAPAMRAALRRAEQLLGRPVPVVSGYRSPEEQRQLWSRRGTNRYPVAAPGASMHERGLAVDVPAAFVATLLAIAPDAGLCQPLPRADPVHFEVCGRGFTPSVRG